MIWNKKKYDEAIMMRFTNESYDNLKKDTYHSLQMRF